MVADVAKQDEKGCGFFHAYTSHSSGVVSLHRGHGRQHHGVCVPPDGDGSMCGGVVLIRNSDVVPMSRSQEIAIKEKIHEARAKQRKFSKWEIEAAESIKHLIMQQSQLEDDIIALEVELAALKSKGQRDTLLSKIGRML